MLHTERASAVDVTATILSIAGGTDPDESQNLIDAPRWLALQTQLHMDLETWWSE